MKQNLEFKSKMKFINKKLKKKPQFKANLLINQKKRTLNKLQTNPFKFNKEQSQTNR